jgi:hypothetical protein
MNRLRLLLLTFAVVLGLCLTLDLHRWTNPHTLAHARSASVQNNSREYTPSHTHARAPRTYHAALRTDSVLEAVPLIISDDLLDAEIPLTDIPTISTLGQTINRDVSVSPTSNLQPDNKTFGLFAFAPRALCCAAGAIEPPTHSAPMPMSDGDTVFEIYLAMFVLAICVFLRGEGK